IGAAKRRHFIHKHRHTDSPTGPTGRRPLQRWLEVTPQITTVRVRPNCRKPRRHSLPVKRAPERVTKPLRAWRAANQARLLLNKPDQGARRDLDRSCCQPHAHTVALTEDACRTIESAAADVTEEPNEGLPHLLREA